MEMNNELSELAGRFYQCEDIVRLIRCRQVASLEELEAWLCCEAGRLNKTITRGTEGKPLKYKGCCVVLEKPEVTHVCPCGWSGEAKDLNAMGSLTYGDSWFECPKCRGDVAEMKKVS